MTRCDTRQINRINAAAGILALLMLAGQSAGQAQFFEGFDNNGPTNNGQDGPANLIAKGWIFRNQSLPDGAHSWFDGYTGDGWPGPQSGAGYLAVDSLSTDYFGGDVSNWAILPAVQGQIAGDVLTFYALDMGGNNINRLQVRYSPGGGTGTGSGPNGVGDFTTVLLDLNPIPVGGWNKHTVTLPGSGRVALRYYIDNACNSGCFSSYTGIDSMSVGDEPPPPCNLPPIPAPGETVVWTAADSPYEVCENIGIPPTATVIVEPGVVVNFDQDTQLVVSGTLEIQGEPADHAVFNYPTVFPPMIEVVNGTVDAHYTEFEGQFRAEEGGSIALTGCEFRGNGLFIGQELPETAPHITLEGCLFDNTYAIISDALVEMYANTFVNGTCWLLRGYSIVADGNTFTGGRITITREDTIQPFYVDGVHAESMFQAAPLQLEGGNFLIGPDVQLENNLYPVQVLGGLVPGSSVPTAGNSINVIDVGSGGFAGPARWPDLGLPYRLTDAGIGDAPDLTIDPGVSVEAVGDAGMVFASGNRLVADGTPEAPITFRAVGQPWQGLIFHVNSTAGPRLEYCTIEDARFGAISTDNHLYVDNCLFRDNLVGANCNTFGSIFFRKTLFTENQAGVAMTDLGTPLLLSFTNPNAFEGNSAAIDAFEFGSSSDANLVWWGHPTGPQHPQNPDGQGDPIIGPGASGVSIFPFLTERPDFANTPPIVRVIEPNLGWRGSRFSADSLLEQDSKYILRWDASDDGAIVSQRIEFSPDGHYQDRFEVLVDNIPGSARTWEITLPDPGFAVTNQPQFLRLVAVDEAGQEAWDQFPLSVPSGRVGGDIEITTDHSGQTFYAGDPIPDMHWTGSSDNFSSALPMIIYESDGSAVAGHNLGGGQGIFFGDFPNISTDRARLAVRASNNSNDVVWFFADGYFSIRHDPRLDLVPPSVSVTSPSDGASFGGGGVVPVRWTASDDEALQTFDIQASYDGGRTFHTVVMDLPAAARSYDWRLPESGGIADVRVRVIARDIRFQNSADESAIAITPGGGCVADFNGDGTVDTRDVLAFLNAWTAGDDRADVNGDGTIDTRDVLAFLNLWNVGC